MNDIVSQTKNAINFIRKLHLEISYFIKEIESLLLLEDERFLILKPDGYKVVTRTSAGLEPSNVDLWMSKDFNVFFCPEELTDASTDITVTRLEEELKLLFFQIKLLGKDISEPIIIYGYFDNINFKKENITKVEQVITAFAYSQDKIFTNPPNIYFEDSYWSFKGKFEQNNLLSINSSEDIKNKIIKPVLKIYRAD